MNVLDISLLILGSAAVVAFRFWTAVSYVRWFDALPKHDQERIYARIRSTQKYLGY